MSQFVDKERKRNLVSLNLTALITHEILVQFFRTASDSISQWERLEKVSYILSEEAGDFLKTILM